MPTDSQKHSPEQPHSSRKAAASSGGDHHYADSPRDGARKASFPTNELNVSIGSSEGGSASGSGVLAPAIRTSFMSGWLDRRTGSGLGKRWKKRFFVIEPHSFVEYRSTHGGATKLFSLREIADILAEDREKFTFGFRFGPSRWISLRATSTEELDDWVSALRRAVIELGPPTPTPTGSGSWRKKSSPTGDKPDKPFAALGTTTVMGEAGLMHRRGKNLPHLSVSDPGSTSARPRGHSEQLGMGAPDRRESELLGSSLNSVSPSHQQLMRRSLETMPMASSTKSSNHHHHNGSRNAPADSLADATTDEGEDDEEDDDEEQTSSDSENEEAEEDDEDFDFNKHNVTEKDDQSSATSSIRAKTAYWGTSLKAFFRRTTAESHDNEEEEDTDAELEEDSGEQSKNGGKKKVFDVRTVQVVEYDVVEIFENQRWFPITNWGTKMLPHDRALWTNRTGHSRTDWYRTSLDPHDAIAVNTATLGTEDREEIPGGQVHVIKDPWQWEGGWRLAPLLSLNPPYSSSAAAAASALSKEKDAFKDGLKRDLRTGSGDSVTDMTTTTAVDEPLTPTATSAPASSTHSMTPHHSSSSSAIQAPASTKHSSSTSMVKSLKRRFTSTSRTSATSSTAGESNNGNHKATTTTLSGPHFTSSSTISVQSAPPSTTTAMTHQLAPSSMSELASPLASTAFDPHQHQYQLDTVNLGPRSEGWAHAFDFPDFDASIARGVPRSHAGSNVRTRRWVRTRRRVVNVTGRFPDNILPFISSVLSFQRQVVAEGYLGVKGRAGNWRNKYYKLVRICTGIWDGGLGEGLVEVLPAEYVLVVSECKEMHQSASKSIRLEPSSSARVLPLPAGYQLPPTAPSEEDSLVVHANRFSKMDHGEVFDDLSPQNAGAMLTSLSRSRAESLGGGGNAKGGYSAAEEPPRAGRFELTLNKDHVFLMNADSRADALAWVSLLNRASSELQKAAEAKEKDLAASASASASAAASSSKQPQQHHHHRKSLLRILKNRGHRLKGVAEEDEGDEEVDAEKEEGEEHVHLEDTGEDPQPNADHPLPSPFPPDSDSKLKEAIRLQLGISLRTFFQTFVGDKARFSIMDFHVEQNDTEVKCSLWTETPPGGRSEDRDDFDFDGWNTVPERLLTFRTNTGAPIGPKVTRVEKRQRYYYYPSAKALVVKTWAKSLDVPFGDAFLVIEKWIITADKDDDHKVEVRILNGAHFLKSVMLKGTIQSSIENGAIRVYPLWRKKFLQFAGAKKALKDTAGGAGAGAEEAEAEGAKAESQGLLSSMASKVMGLGEVVVPAVSALSRFGSIVFVLWWMLQLLWVLQRIADALEGKSIDIIRKEE